MIRTSGVWAWEERPVRGLGQPILLRGWHFDHGWDRARGQTVTSEGGTNTDVGALGSTGEGETESGDTDKHTFHTP